MPSLDDTERLLTQKGAPYALVPCFFEGGPALKFAHGPQRLRDIFFLLGKRRDGPFISSNGCSFTFREVHDKAVVCSAFLAEHYGAVKGERIALIGDNSVEWIVWFFAILALGSVPVLVPTQNCEMIARHLETVFCHIAIVDFKFEIALKKTGLVQHIVRMEIGQFKYKGGLAEAHRKASSVIAASDNEALVTFTSGSTGLPKAVSQSDLGVTTGLMNMMLAGTLTKTKSRQSTAEHLPPCSLVVTALYHSIGYVQMLFAVLLGSRLVLPGSYDTDTLANSVEKEKITSISGLSRIGVHNLLFSGDASRKLASIINWSFPGEGADVALMSRISSVTPKATVVGGYGLTETNGGISANLGADILTNVGAAGRVVPTAEIKICGDDANALPFGERGLIWVRGAMLMRGYIGPDGQVAGLSEGWFCTGDYGSMSRERELRVFGRHAGDEIQPKASLGDLERFARQDNDVIDACGVWAIVHGKKRRVLFIVTEQRNVRGNDDISAGARKRLANACCAEDVICTLEPCEVPKTGSGKVDRASLIAAVETGSFAVSYPYK